ncbi:MAG: trypsin-like peptidase domain-containing protein [Meiothermus sp.]|uniref:S1C family serine protease n=2 Tax=Meiothermus sp. TaxID=1955249 RepID=UPI0025F95B3B|nr:trypsin-like peptidase domain-containing protein [Meiothermus sp.]MCS7059282.1 trypsin-like peptidase domain-containing protein [Meiothermus sp.]MCS7195175.1 trypsin-like peptidase domain-containing protein [Meiothermus sp.]MCX7741572.1 trypsin-like peptidase domain-containing protein [Meiothermus sp.]MDW8091698.1 trypsin-like peptidase domain-containing protein [Meiothermus sp.]MDW8482102.1 trypsin-like peptidase domain-containing protein [Meiothermus sp.]
MSMRSASLFLGLLLVVGGGVAWFNLSKSQNPSPEAAVQAQAQPFEQSRAFLENERNTIEVVQRSGDGVVFVAVRSTPQVSRDLGFFAPFLQPQPQEGSGSGFVLDQDGLILTNYHVIEGADQITVRFHNDPKSYPARVVGTAEPLDLALIRVQAPRDRLKPMRLGDSDQVRVGQKAIAMGNPFGLEFTVTEGIVSAIRRNPNDGSGSGKGAFVPTVIQTDAAINPGNSGGPLLNSRGEVIGINTFIYSSTGALGTAQSAGIGFAIPINLAKQYLADLKAGKNITAEEIVRSRPRLGVTLSLLSMAEYPENIRRQNRLPDTGLMIQQVERGSPAERAGLRPATRTVQLQLRTGQVIELGLNGDIILEADGNPIVNINDLRAVLLSKKQGEAVTLKVWREGQTREVRVVPQVIR